MRNKVPLFGIYIALALIFSYIELLIPSNYGLPGAKLGLANLVILIVLYNSGWKDALIVSVVRILISGILFGNAFSIVYSMVGGIFSLFTMIVLKKTNKFSMIGISAVGGVTHNIGQLFVAMVVLETVSVRYYLSLLILVGLFTGIIMGIVSKEVLKRLPTKSI